MSRGILYCVCGRNRWLCSSPVFSRPGNPTTIVTTVLSSLLLRSWKRGTSVHQCITLLQMELSNDFIECLKVLFNHESTFCTMEKATVTDFLQICRVIPHAVTGVPLRITPWKENMYSAHCPETFISAHEPAHLNQFKLTSIANIQYVIVLFKRG